MHATLQFEDRSWRVDLAHGRDISIPLAFDSAQPSFFGAAPAKATPLSAGSFSGEVRTGAGCNCATYTLTPHCNGTHTESAGHVTVEPHSVHLLAREALIAAHVSSVSVQRAAEAIDEHDVVTHSDDLLITARALNTAAERIRWHAARALVVRTLPNPEAKRTWHYGDTQQAAYFTSRAMQWIVARGIEHLVVDVPSLDRSDDGGRLLCHRLFWGMAARESSDTRIARPHASVTELAYVADDIPDGLYVLNLQIAPFVADAAPSRPVLYPMVPL